MLLAAADPCGEQRRVWLCHWVGSWTDNRTAADVAQVGVALVQHRADRARGR